MHDADVDGREAAGDARAEVGEREPLGAVGEQAVALERQRREGRVGAEEADRDRRAEPGIDLEGLGQEREQEAERERAGEVDCERPPREGAGRAVRDQAVEAVAGERAERTGDGDTEDCQSKPPSVS